MKIPWLVTKVSLWRRTYGTIRLSRCAAGKNINLQEAMENFVFPDEIKTKFMEANCFVENASLLTFNILKIFRQRLTFTRNGVKATWLTLLVASSNSKLCTACTGNWADLLSWKGHNITHQELKFLPICIEFGSSQRYLQTLDRTRRCQTPHLKSRGL